MACVAVLYSHSFILAGEDEPTIHLLNNINPAFLAVNFFFFLSGYLMYSALSRCDSQLVFFINRLSRIVPGLVVCVCLTLILGFFITTCSAIDYFGNVIFFKYLGNAIFLFYPSLPGVFEDNHYPLVVNGSLWTLFYEVVCYFSLSFLIFFKHKTKILISLLIIGLCFLHLSVVEYNGPTFWSNISRLSIMFCAGYLFSNSYKKTHYHFIVLTVLMFCYLFEQFIQPIAEVLLVSALFSSILLDIFLRFDRYFPNLPFDSSFGIYIYSFPIQQFLIYNNPSLNSYQLFIYSFFLVFPVATVSWFYVEKPYLKKIRDIKKLLK